LHTPDHSAGLGVNPCLLTERRFVENVHVSGCGRPDPESDLLSGAEHGSGIHVLPSLFAVYVDENRERFRVCRRAE
jgi:hypothetical protein